MRNQIPYKMPRSSKDEKTVKLPVKNSVKKMYKQQHTNNIIIAGKVLIGIYAAGAIANGIATIYRRGKNKALEFRMAKKFDQNTPYKKESEALWAGARSGLLVSIPNAIFWPIRVFVNLLFKITNPSIGESELDKSELDKSELDKSEIIET